MAFTVRSAEFAVNFILYGTVGTASSAVVYLLNEQIRQVNRLKLLFDPNARKRFLELAREHGVPESRIRWTLGSGPIEPPTEDSQRVFTQPKDAEEQAPVANIGSQGGSQTAHPRPAKCSLYFNSPQYIRRTHQLHSKWQWRRRLSPRSVRCYSSGECLISGTRLFSTNAISRHAATSHSTETLQTDTSNSKALSQHDISFIRGPSISGKSTTQVNPLPEVRDFMASLSDLDHSSPVMETKIPILLKFIFDQQLTYENAVDMLNQHGAHSLVLYLCESDIAVRPKRIKACQRSIFSSFEMLIRDSNDKDAVFARIRYAFLKLLAFLDIQELDRHLQSSSSDFLVDALFPDQVGPRPDAELAAIRLLSTRNAIKEDVFILNFSRCFRPQSKNAEKTAVMILQRDIDHELYSLEKVRRSQWMDLAIKNKFFKASTHLLNTFAPLIQEAEYLAFLKAILKLYTGTTLDEAKLATLTTILNFTPKRIGKYVQEELLHILKAPSALSSAQREQLAQAALKMLQSPELAHPKSLTDTQARAIFEQWRCKGDFALCQQQIKQNLAALDSESSEKMLLSTCMALGFQAQDWSFAGRIAMALLKRFPDIKSSWTEMIPILATIAAAGFFDALQVVMDALSKANLIPPSATARREFQPVVLALTRSPAAEYKTPEILEFLAKMVVRDQLPVGGLALRNLVQMVMVEDVSLEQLRGHLRTVTEIAKQSSEHHRLPVRQWFVYEVYKKLVVMSPVDSVAHMNRFKKICEFDMNLVSKELCAFAIDGLSSGFLEGYEYRRLAGHTLEGVHWRKDRFDIVNRLRMDLATQTIRGVASRSDWLPMMRETRNLQPLSDGGPRRKPKTTAQLKVFLTRMRQAMAGDRYDEVQSILSSCIKYNNGQIPDWPSLYCIPISAQLRQGHVRDAVAIRNQVAAQGSLDVMAADFMLEMYHISQVKTYSDFEAYRHIIEIWRMYDNGPKSIYLVNILSSIVKRLRREEDLAKATLLLLTIYDERKHKMSADLRGRLLQLFFMLYSQNLNLAGLIWTIRTAVVEGINWNYGFTHTVTHYSRQVLAEFQNAAISLASDSGGFKSSRITNNANQLEYEKAVFAYRLVWATLSRLRSLVSKMHFFQRLDYIALSKSLMNTVLHGMTPSGATVSRPKEHLGAEDVEQTSEPEFPALNDRQNISWDDANVELDDPEQSDGEANLLQDMQETDLEELGAQGLEADSDPQSNSSYTDQLAHIYYATSETVLLLNRLRTATQPKKDPTERRLQFAYKNFPSALIPVHKQSLYEKITAFSHILQDENDQSPKTLAENVASEVEWLCRMADKELGEGTCWPVLCQTVEGELVSGKDGPPLPRQRPFERRPEVWVKQSGSPWGDVSPVSGGPVTMKQGKAKSRTDADYKTSAMDRLASLSANANKSVGETSQIDEKLDTTAFHRQVNVPRRC